MLKEKGKRKQFRAFIGFNLVMSLMILTSSLLFVVQDHRAEAAVALPLPPVPAGLKPQLMLGVSNRPGHTDWLTSTGAKWDMRYQYLVGGVNTSNNWTTWDSPAGKYADDFTYESASAGLLPVFTYYQLLSSLPASGANEAEKDYNNLNNPATMQAYFADFKLLMDKARTFGKAVIVHIEPDLWGFLQKRSADPDAIRAAVASSGYNEVAAYSNSVAGFAQALVGLRDKYAPNVLLAYHISPWGAKAGDVGFSRDPNFNVQGAAQETASFYLATKANFDLIFYDISDRDAGYYDSIGDPNHWWDATNSSFPNFNRWHQYLTAITTLTGKRGMLWQVPIGNTLYKTMNNTPHHWQDNRVQYYLNEQGQQHLEDLANAGIVGILFGPGDQQSTWNDDNAGDGVTNPDPVNGNNLTASFSDDDGGYLRLQAQAYYKRGPVALPEGVVITPPANPTSTPIPTATTTAPPPTIATTTSTPSPTSAPPPSATPAPPKPEPQPQPAKAALLKVKEVRASGNDENAPATNLVDGNPDSYWLVSGAPKSAWVSLDLGEARQLSEVRYFVLGTGHATHTQIQYSSDGTSWTTFSNANNIDTGDAWGWHSLDAARVSGRYVRFQLDNSDQALWDLGFYSEVQVWGN